MALVGPRVLNYLSESKVKAARIQIESFSSALDLFYLDNGRYPSSSEGLPALVQRPANSSSWNGPYLKTGSVPSDPWGRPYIYRSPADHAPYEIASYGSSGQARGHRRARSRAPRNSRAMKRAAGFTLIEVVCVLAIIALARQPGSAGHPARDVPRAARSLRGRGRGDADRRSQRRHSPSYGRSPLRLTRLLGRYVRAPAPIAFNCRATSPSTPCSPRHATGGKPARRSSFSPAACRAAGPSICGAEMSDFKFASIGSREGLRLFRSTLRPNSHSRGFTLVESLVALADHDDFAGRDRRLDRVVASLRSICRTSRGRYRKHPANPRRAARARRAGERNASPARWRVIVGGSTLRLTGPISSSPSRATPWTPQIIALRVQSPNGGVTSVDMVRLVRTRAQ